MADKPPNISSAGDNPTRMGSQASRSGEVERAERERLAMEGFLLPGHVLSGQFEIVRPLGREGMGVVYEAFNP